MHFKVRLQFLSESEGRSYLSFTMPPGDVGLGAELLDVAEIWRQLVGVSAIGLNGGVGPLDLVEAACAWGKLHDFPGRALA